MAVLLVLCMPCQPRAGDPEKDGGWYRVGGYCKNLLIAAEDRYGEERGVDLTRLRLELDMSSDVGLSARIIYDNEVFSGPVVDSAGFGAFKESDPMTYYDLEDDLSDRGDIYWRHSLYRAHLDFKSGPFSATLGRQRIALGTGRIWNPEDLLDPLDPLRIEWEEKTGADALNLELIEGALSSLMLAWAPGKDTSEESYFLRQKTNWKGYDFSGMAGVFRKEKVVGADFSGYAGESGFRGELTYTEPDERDAFARLVLSLDHTFKSSVYALLEYLHNGAGDGVLLSASGMRASASAPRDPARNFVGALMGYDLTALFRAEALSILDMDHGSVFFSPSLRYNILGDLDLRAGVELFDGADRSEFGGMDDIYYAEAQWFF